MATEIDLYSGGGVAPYSPSQPLAPAPDWGATDVDPLRESTVSHSGGGQVVFGQTLPAGVSIADMQNAFGQLATVFQSDFTALKHKASHIQAAVSWMINALTNPPQQQRQHHSYNLFEHKSDPIFQAFANYAHDHGFSAKFVQDACWWITETTKKLNAQQVGTLAQGSAPLQPNLADLTDAQFDTLMKHNENVKAATMGFLHDKYGACFRQNMAVAEQYLNKLTPAEAEHFNKYTGAWPWTHMSVTREFWVGLFEMAIGANSIPTSGPDIAKEILQIEALLRDPASRKAYLKDDALQARYRQLLSLTLGGR